MFIKHHNYVYQACFERTWALQKKKKLKGGMTKTSSAQQTTGLMYLVHAKTSDMHQIQH